MKKMHFLIQIVYKYVYVYLFNFCKKLELWKVNWTSFVYLDVSRLSVKVVFTWNTGMCAEKFNTEN